MLLARIVTIIFSFVVNEMIGLYLCLQDWESTIDLINYHMLSTLLINNNNSEMGYII